MMRNAGMQLPEAWRNPPVLEPDLVWYMDAFQDLSTERQLGFSVGPIPTSAIREFIKVEEIEDEDFKLLIRVMDGEYLKFIAEQNTKEK